MKKNILYKQVLFTIIISFWVVACGITNDDDITIMYGSSDKKPYAPKEKVISGILHKSKGHYLNLEEAKVSEPNMIPPIWHLAMKGKFGLTISPNYGNEQPDRTKLTFFLIDYNMVDTKKLFELLSKDNASSNADKVPVNSDNIDEFFPTSALITGDNFVLFPDDFNDQGFYDITMTKDACALIAIMNQAGKIIKVYKFAYTKVSNVSPYDDSKIEFSAKALELFSKT